MLLLVRGPSCSATAYPLSLFDLKGPSLAHEGA
jgi:hypothetical protein